MNTYLLQTLMGELKSRGVRDITQSLFNKEPELSLETGFMHMLAYLPEINIKRIINFIKDVDTIASINTLLPVLRSEGLFEFEPYLLEDNKYKTVLVCAINRLVVYDEGYIKVMTDLQAESVLCCSKCKVTCLIEEMRLDVSVDAYNALLATVLSTAYMCSSIRKDLMTSGTVITNFLRSLIRECKVYSIYSADTFRSKLSWVNLAEVDNQNYSIYRDDRCYCNVSIGDSAVTIEYVNDLDSIGHLTFLYDRTKLGTYDKQFAVKSGYFAYALYLLLSDVFTECFTDVPETNIMYYKIDSAGVLYRK